MKNNNNNTDTDDSLFEGEALDAEYGMSKNIEEKALIAGIFTRDSTVGKNIIAFHAYMQNLPEDISKAASALMEEMSSGFPASKKYFGNLCENMKTILNPKTMAENAAEAFHKMRESFGELYEYAKADMGKDLYNKFSSFIQAVSENFSKFVEITKEKMTPAYEKANQAFGEMYDKVAEVTKPTRDAIGESAAYQKAKEVGSKVAESAKEFGNKVYKPVAPKRTSEAQEL
jgi:gas vesicle protein